MVAADGKQAGDKYSAQSVRQGKTTRLEWKVRRLSVFPFFFSCAFFSIPSAYEHGLFFGTKKKLFVVPSKRLCPIAYFPIVVVLCDIARLATAFFFVCVPTRRWLFMALVFFYYYYGVGLTIGLLFFFFFVSLIVNYYVKPTSFFFYYSLKLVLWLCSIVITTNTTTIYVKRKMCYIGSVRRQKKPKTAFLLRSAASASFFKPQISQNRQTNKQLFFF